MSFTHRHHLLIRSLNRILYENLLLFIDSNMITADGDYIPDIREIHIRHFTSRIHRYFGYHHEKQSGNR